MKPGLRVAALAVATVALLPLAAPLAAVGAADAPVRDPRAGITEPAPSRSPYSAPARKKVKIGVVRVVLSEQRVYVYDTRRRLVATMPVSTGLDGSTPTGRFRIFSKSRSTFYRADPRHRMKWMTRFTVGEEGDNIGFHSIPYLVTGKSTRRIPTPIGREPSSNGCVRMRTRDAQWIYDNALMGTRVIVEEHLPGTSVSAPSS